MQHELEKEKDLQAQWKENVTIPVTNNDRAGIFCNKKDHLFKVEITATDSQRKQSLNIHYEKK